MIILRKITYIILMVFFLFPLSLSLSEGQSSTFTDVNLCYSKFSRENPKRVASGEERLLCETLCVNSVSSEIKNECLRCIDAYNSIDNRRECLKRLDAGEYFKSLSSTEAIKHCRLPFNQGGRFVRNNGTGPNLCGSICKESITRGDCNSCVTQYYHSSDGGDNFVSCLENSDNSEENLGEFIKGVGLDSTLANDCSKYGLITECKECFKRHNTKNKRSECVEREVNTGLCFEKLGKNPGDYNLCKSQTIKTGPGSSFDFCVIQEGEGSTPPKIKACLQNKVLDDCGDTLQVNDKNIADECSKCFKTFPLSTPGNEKLREQCLELAKFKSLTTKRNFDIPLFTKLPGLGDLTNESNSIVSSELTGSLNSLIGDLFIVSIYIIFSITVLMVAYGGLRMLVSGVTGDPSKYQDGKNTIIGALSGLFIVLISVLILGLVNNDLVSNPITNTEPEPILDFEDLQEIDQRGGGGS